MELLVLNKDVVEITAYALFIKEFEKLWIRDKSKDKSRAAKELSFIYLLNNYKSPYASIIDEKERLQLVLEDINITLDEDIIAASNKYKEIQDSSTYALKYLYAARKAAEEMRKFFETVDLTERTKAGMPVYKPRDIAGAIADSAKMIEAIDKWEDRVKKDIELTDTDIRGGGVAGSYED